MIRFDELQHGLPVDEYALQAHIYRLEQDNARLQRQVQQLQAIIAYADARDAYRIAHTAGGN